MNERIKIFSILAVILIFYNTNMIAANMNIATVNVGNRGFYDDSGLKQGSSYDIMNRIVEGAGFSYKNDFMPFGRVIAHLKTGEVDLALLVPNEVVNKVATPLFHIQDVDFIVVGRKGFQIDRLEDIDGKRVGFLRMSPTANNIFQHLNVVNIQGGKYTRLINMLIRNRIDVIFGPKSSILGALRELNFSPETLLGASLSIQKLEMHLVYSKKLTDTKILMSLINSATQLKKENIIQGIINKYDQPIQMVD
jgi:ABC-type amino acid transport substrate-binding protein